MGMTTKSKYCLISILMLILSCVNVAVSQDSISVVSGALLEDLLENNDEQAYDFFSLYDELKTYLDDPINVNTATADDLRNMGLLSDIQIMDLLEHREKFGDFLSQYEIQSIPSFDIGTMNAFIPFITVGGAGSRKNIGSLLSEASQNVIAKYKRTVQTKRGYTDAASSPYLGNEDYYFLRYNLTSGRNLRVGVTMEKDAGEEFFTGSNKKGFDYYTGFIYLRDVHPFWKEVNIGDYTISMGQGMIMHNSFGAGKSSYVMNIKRGGSVIRPYSSVNEFNLNRGLAATMQLTKNTEVTVFGSIKKIDGNSIVSDSTINTGFERFSSFVINGLHRTESEIAKRGTVTQSTAGLVAKYRFSSRFHVGANVLYNRFSSELTPSDQAFRRFSFRGDQLGNASLDYSYRLRNINVFGEVATSDNGAVAQVHGALLSLGRNIDAGMVYRDYAKDYQVLNGNAFGESTQPVNEKGMYFSLQMRPWRSITVSTYVDIWSHPWLRSRVSAPSDGRELLAKIEYNKKRKFNAYFQYRYEEKAEDISDGESNFKRVVDRSQHRARLNFSYSYSKELSLVSRLEYNHFTKDEEASTGYLAYQDMKYKPIGKPYSFAARYAIFSTDDFNSRIYMFENDVLYEFSIPFYSGRGTRFYIKSQFQITRKLYLQARYARTYLNNVSDILLPDGSYLPLIIGSGNESTIGNVRSDVKLVLKYKI